MTDGTQTAFGTKQAIKRLGKCLLVHLKKIEFIFNLCVCASVTVCACECGAHRGQVPGPPPDVGARNQVL